MSRPLHIACLQTQPKATMAQAIDEAVPNVEAAARAGAQMIFLPEYCGGLRTEGARVAAPSAPEQDHPMLEALRSVAARSRVWLSVGSVAVDGPDGKIFNRGYMLNDRGETVGSYDKLHMFDIALSETEVYRESDTVNPGGVAQVYDTPFGRVGHTICYDLRFPHLFRDLAQAGAEIICCPAAFTKKTGEAHWHVLNRARAIENTVFMVSACAVGAIPGGGESYGHSLVVGPWGDVLADGSDIPGVVHTQIDLEQVAATQKRIPSITHDRDYRLIELKKDVA